MATKPVTSKPPVQKAANAKTKPSAVAQTARQSAPVKLVPPKPVPANPVAAKPEAAKLATTPTREKPLGNSNALKKKDLIDSVVQITGAKKKTARDIVEATLKVLGDALSKGDMLNLPPFGKAKVSRPQDAGSGKPMTVKLRRISAGRSPKEGLADPEDNG